MNKLPKLIENMSEKDLINLRKDLLAGNLDKLISKRLQNIRNYSEKNCAVCGAKIDANSLILEFGKEYLRKRAYFDEKDCMNYFLQERLK